MLSNLVVKYVLRKNRKIKSMISKTNHVEECIAKCRPPFPFLFIGMAAAIVDMARLSSGNEPFTRAYSLGHSLLNFCSPILIDSIDVAHARGG